jgi:DNA-binding NtrC family response regulator
MSLQYDMVSLTDKKPLLVVDDDPNMLELLQRHLTSQGYKVLAAKGVVEAIRLLGTTPIDLVITDMKMPKSSGLDLVKYVRENMKNTGVMIVTGYATIKGAIAAAETGALEYLIKPFTEEELLAVVQRAFDKMQNRSAMQAHHPCRCMGQYGTVS